MYIDNLADIVNEYSNTYHSSIKMKSVDVKFSTYIESGKDNNKKDPKFKVGDHVNYMLNEKTMLILLMVGLIKKR